MPGRAGTRHDRIVIHDDAALTAAVLGTALGLLTLVPAVLLFRSPLTLPLLAVPLALAAVSLVRRLACVSAAPPLLLGSLAAAPILAFALLLTAGLGPAAALGIPLAAATALAAASAARAAHPAPADAPPSPACPACAYSLAGLQHAPRCPECGFPDHADAATSNDEPHRTPRRP